MLSRKMQTKSCFVKSWTQHSHQVKMQRKSKFSDNFKWLIAVSHIFSLLGVKYSKQSWFWITRSCIQYTANTLCLENIKNLQFSCSDKVLSSQLVKLPRDCSIFCSPTVLKLDWQDEHNFEPQNLTQIDRPILVWSKSKRIILNWQTHSYYNVIVDWKFNNFWRQDWLDLWVFKEIDLSYFFSQNFP